jgi:cobalt-zinc-cadmium efflux system outer membrane protein
MPARAAPLLRLEVEVARARAERDALAARRAGEEARLALVVGDDAARVVATDPARFLGAARDAAAQPERALAAIAIEMAEADTRLTQAGRLPAFMVGADVRVMPGGMVDGVDAEVGVTVPLWGGSRARVQAATAAADAASCRSEGVDRGLADAIAAARADEAAATARERALAEVAVPGARAAWDATVAAWGGGAATAADLVAAWQASVAVARDAADAQLAAEVARARRARLEGP